MDTPGNILSVLRKPSGLNSAPGYNIADSGQSKAQAEHMRLPVQGKGLEDLVVSWKGRAG